MGPVKVRLASKVQSTKYKVQNTKYKAQSTKYKNTEDKTHLSPPMISRMPWLNSHECAATRCANLIVGNQLAFNSCAILSGFDDAGHKLDRSISRRRAEQLDCVIGSDRARRMI